MARLINTVGTGLLVAMLAGLAGCGVKGPLELPPGVEDKSAPPDQSGTKPHRPFILDKIL